MSSRRRKYGLELAANIRSLHERMKTARYRHQPIRRVHIPKANGALRPLGISCTEDKIVQGALATLLSVIYEPVFLKCSYGFRPGRSAHDAMRALHGITEKVTWILEADIEAFFDSVDRKQLMAELRKRIDDESLLRLVGKCLHVGILEGEMYSEPDIGTVQGSALSPLLGNVYLHYALDEWFARDVEPRLKGAAKLEGRSVYIVQAEGGRTLLHSERTSVRRTLEHRLGKLQDQRRADRSQQRPQ